jgi:hypothetical protein
MLTESSVFPIIALTRALPQSSKIRGLSYMVLANLRYRGSGESTENSLYPYWLRREGIAEEDRPSEADVRK